MKQSGGYVSIETELGHGSTFNVFFPLVEKSAAPPPVDAPGLPAGAALTVLLVEDDDVVRAVVAEMLAELGYVVREAGGSEEALELAGDRDELDILLTDVVMPGLGGPELAVKVASSGPGFEFSTCLDTPPGPAATPRKLSAPAPPSFRSPSRSTCSARS